MNVVAARITKQLEVLQTSIGVLEDANVTSENPKMIELESRITALDECQRLIALSSKAVEQNESYKGTFGNANVNNNAFYVEGNVTGQSYKVVEYSAGDITVGSGSTSFRGLGNPDLPSIMKAAYTSRSTANQQSTPAGASSTNPHKQGGEASNEDEHEAPGNNSAPAVPLAIRSAEDSKGEIRENLWAALPRKNASQGRVLAL